MSLRHTLLALSLAAPLTLLGMTGAGQAPLLAQQAAKATVAAPSTTSVDQATTSRLVYGLLSDSRYAYRPRALDDALSQEIFKRYLEALDPNKLFFSAQDVARFDAYRTRMDDAIKSGQLQPAHEMFALYKKRVGERVAFARGLLKQDIFDFTGQDKYVYDREDLPWPATPAELDQQWKQSVRYDWLRLKLAGKQPDEIRKTLDKRYLNIEKGVADIGDEDIFQTVLNAYTGAIDPHTDYFNPRSAERFNQSMTLSLEGIGAQLQKRDDIVTIMELIPGGPAALSKRLKPGDRIVGVGQGNNGAIEDVVGWRIDDVVAKIKGKKGTQVRLHILPADAAVDAKPNELVLTRDKIKLTEEEAKSKIIELPATGGQPARRIGVIELPGFYEDFEARRRPGSDGASSSRDVARLLQEFKQQNVDGVVVDLRNNGGGSLGEAVKITGLFIDEGPVVQVRESGGRVQVDGDDEPGVLWDGPLAVMINRASASASEIFAGAIQDYGRGIIIGETSFGKGTVQSMVDLDRWPGNRNTQYGDVKLTIAQFFLPGGSSTQNKGVVPDIAFPSTMDPQKYGESSYDNALPWTKIPAAPHTRYGNFAPVLPQLRQMHDSRAKADLEYQWLVEDAAEMRRLRAEKSITLNEAERRAERAKDEAKRKSRQEERKRLGLALNPFADESDDGLQSSERDVAREAERGKLAKDLPDPFLREAAMILGDAARLLGDDRALAKQVLPESTRPGAWTE